MRAPSTLASADVTASQSCFGFPVVAHWQISSTMTKAGRKPQAPAASAASTSSVDPFLAVALNESTLIEPDNSGVRATKPAIASVMRRPWSRSLARA